MDRAAAELATVQPAREANSDAKALTRYLSAIGLKISPDRLNDLLVLLSVVMIELAAGCRWRSEWRCPDPSERPNWQRRTLRTACRSAPFSRNRTLRPRRLPRYPPSSRLRRIGQRIPRSCGLVAAAGGRTEGVRRLAGALDGPGQRCPTSADDWSKPDRLR